MSLSGSVVTHETNIPDKLVFAERKEFATKPIKKRAGHKKK